MNPRLVRGLDYYTRTAFEVWHEALGGAQNSLGGGGRYDGLAATLGWPETPGVGFAVGLDRIASLLPAIDDEPAKVGIIPISPDDVAPAMTIAGRLRATGVSSVVQASDRGLRASLRHAQKLRVSHVVILGREELERGMVRVKPMTGEGPEELVQLEALTARLGGLAG
jgi:histidyl-tRNA synthetase